MTDWPKHESGRNKRVGEMTPAERKAAFSAATSKLKAEFEHPDTQAKIQAVLRGTNVNN